MACAANVGLSAYWLGSWGPLGLAIDLKAAAAALLLTLVLFCFVGVRPLLLGRRRVLRSSLRAPLPRRSSRATQLPTSVSKASFIHLVCFLAHAVDPTSPAFAAIRFWREHLRDWPCLRNWVISPISEEVLFSFCDQERAKGAGSGAVPRLRRGRAGRVPDGGRHRGRLPPLLLPRPPPPHRGAQATGPLLVRSRRRLRSPPAPFKTPQSSPTPLISGFQALYTYVFGAYASFLFLRSS